MPVFNKITELFTKLKDGAGNLITSTDLGGGKRGLDVNVEITPSESTTIKDADIPANTLAIDSIGNIGAKIYDNDNNSAQIGKDGRLHVNTASPQDIDGYTAIFTRMYESLESYKYALNYYVIPSGKELIITNVSMSASGGNNSAGIYYIADGVFDNETINHDLIRGAYFGVGPEEFQVDKSYTGDGTAAIVMKITRRDKGTEWVACDWSGFIQD